MNAHAEAGEVNAVFRPPIGRIPHDFRRNMGFFRDALVLRAVPLREILMFMLRGLLPAGAQRRLLNVYFRAREKSFALSHPERT